jgi:type VI protein secretion system component Hcp
VRFVTNRDAFGETPRVGKVRMQDFHFVKKTDRASP